MANPWRATVDRYDQNLLTTRIDAWVVEMEMERGCRHGQRVAPASWARIICRASTNFPTGTSNFGIEKGMAIKVTKYGVRDEFVGWVWDVKRVDRFPDRVDLMAYGSWHWISKQRLTMPVEEDVRSDEILVAALDAARPPHRDYVSEADSSKPYAVVGDAVKGLVGGSYVHDTDFDDYSFSEGKSTFPFAGDSWEDASIGDIAEEVLGAERGLLYEDGDGQLVFKNRHEFLGLSVDVTITNPRRFVMTYGDDHVNQVVLTTRPRVKETNTILWTNAQNIEIPSGQARVACKYTDSLGEVVGVSGDAVLGSFQVRTGKDGTGTVCTGGYSLSQEGTRGVINIDNNMGHICYVQPGATIIGTALIKGDAIEAVGRAALSQFQHGLIEERRDVPLIESADQLVSLARTTCRERSTPTSWVRQIELDGDIHKTETETYDIGDVVRVDLNSEPLHDENYYIWGIRHEVTKGGYKQKTTWFLTPVNAGNYAIVGKSAVGNCVVAY